MWAGIAAARVGERRVLELVEQVRPRHLPRCARTTSWTTASRCRAARFEKLPKGTFHPRRGAGQRHGLHASPSRSPTTSSSSTSATTPTRTTGPNNASRDGCLVAAQMVFMNVTDTHRRRERRALSPADAADTPRIGFRRRARPRLSRSTTRSKIRLYDLIWRCLAPHLGDRLPAGSFASICGTFIGGPHPDTGGTSRSSSRRSAAGARRATRDGNSAVFSGFHGDTFNCPAEVAEARYGLYVDRLALNDAAGRRRRASRRQGHRARVPGPG